MAKRKRNNSQSPRSVGVVTRSMSRGGALVVNTPKKTSSRTGKKQKVTFNTTSPGISTLSTSSLNAGTTQLIDAIHEQKISPGSGTSTKKKHRVSTKKLEKKKTMSCRENYVRDPKPPHNCVHGGDLGICEPRKNPKTGQTQHFVPNPSYIPGSGLRRCVKAGSHAARGGKTTKIKGKSVVVRTAGPKGPEHCGPHQVYKMITPKADAKQVPDLAKFWEKKSRRPAKGEVVEYKKKLEPYGRCVAAKGESKRCYADEFLGTKVIKYKTPPTKGHKDGHEGEKRQQKCIKINSKVASEWTFVKGGELGYVRPKITPGTDRYTKEFGMYEKVCKKGCPKDKKCNPASGRCFDPASKSGSRTYAKLVQARDLRTEREAARAAYSSSPYAIFARQMYDQNKTKTLKPKNIGLMWQQQKLATKS